MLPCPPGVPRPSPRFGDSDFHRPGGVYQCALLPRTAARRALPKGTPDVMMRLAHWQPSGVRAASVQDSARLQGRGPHTAGGHGRNRLVTVTVPVGSGW
jgi:hypothetical protein